MCFDKDTRRVIHVMVINGCCDISWIIHRVSDRLHHVHKPYGFVCIEISLSYHGIHVISHSIYHVYSHSAFRVLVNVARYVQPKRPRLNTVNDVNSHDSDLFKLTNLWSLNQLLDSLYWHECKYTYSLPTVFNIYNNIHTTVH